MAITGIEYAIFETLRTELPPKPSVLQLGEANWYGDVPLSRLIADVRKHVDSAIEQNALLAEIQRSIAESKPDLFSLAQVFWRVFVDPGELATIDLGGTRRSFKLDLNTAINLNRQFDMVLNLGTAEHVFNTCQVFKTIHDHTKPGGLMLHGAPFAGWFDHGFYNFQPTFWWDVAAANGYIVHDVVVAQLKPLVLRTVHTRDELLNLIASGQVGSNALLYPTYRKGASERPFQIPMQGYYAGRISDAARTAWTKMR